MKSLTPRRIVALAAGALLLQLAFIGSYVGAFHDPTPHRVPLAVVAPDPQVAASYDALPGAPLDARPVATQAAARAQLERGEVAGVLVAGSGTTDRLLVAGGGGGALADAVQTVVERAETRQGRSATVTDAVPAQAGDARGLTGFYLVIGWLVGGYLAAALLGVVTGPRPADSRAARRRLLGFVPYAVVSGLGGVLVVDALIGAQTGAFLGLWALGAGLVLASAYVTSAMQGVFGVIGIGLAILLFVVLGNPSAGGAYQAELLPGLWREVGPLLPNGAGVDAVRRLVYFGGHGIAGHVAVVAAWIAAGAVVTLAAARRRVTA